MKCVVFRCSRKQEMYLYVAYQAVEKDELVELPAELAKLTGSLTKVMELDLQPGQKLARAEPQAVIESLSSKGFYIQMPPCEIMSKETGILHDPADSF